MLRIEHVAPHPIKSQANKDNMDTEDYNRQLVVTKSTEDARREGDKADEHEKEGVDVGEHRVHCFCIDRDKEVMRPPIGKEKREGEYIREKYRE